MEIQDLIIDANATVGNNLLFTDIIPIHEYDSEKKKTGKISAYKYGIVMPDRQYNKIYVKIPGKQLLNSPTKNECESVILENLQFSIYFFNGIPKIIATATGISIVED